MRILLILLLPFLLAFEDYRDPPPRMDFEHHGSDPLYGEFSFGYRVVDARQENAPARCVELWSGRFLIHTFCVPLENPIRQNCLTLECLQWYGLDQEPPQ